MSWLDWRRKTARRRLGVPSGLWLRAPLDVRVVGRTFLHAALVGAAAGACACIFVVATDWLQALVLEQWCGYDPLRTRGEAAWLTAPSRGPFRPWLLVFVPGLGALLGGVVCRWAPETRGGGGNAMVEAFHRSAAQLRARVIPVRMLSAVFTLSSGGSGGREGPTMQMGAAIGAQVAELLRLRPRERRILYIAGVAAGMSAVFRTPFGAALLAVEVLYRDDFESEALVPAIMASVVAYSISIALFGHGSSLFGALGSFCFQPLHLPLYALLAFFVAALAAGFVAVLDGVHALAARLRVPAWLKPGLGGLALGLVATPVIVLMGHQLGLEDGEGLGLLGSGYGEIQLVLSGSTWLPSTWHSVILLALLLLCKLLASALTIGSGGSAGDFAPCMVLGGLAGGLFGRAVSLLLGDPSIEPGAFALVGMATFYGGIAHTPLGSLMMACEMAGSYDLLVPLMLAESLAFMALRRRSLYAAQVPSLRESPVHRDGILSDALRRLCVSDVLDQNRPFVTFDVSTPGSRMLQLAAERPEQQVFPVLEKSAVWGVVTADLLRALAIERDALAHTVAADVAQPAAVVSPGDNLRVAYRALVKHRLRTAVVLSDRGAVAGLLDESDLAQVYLAAADRAEHMN